MLDVDDVEAADMLDVLVSRSLVTSVVEDGRVRGYGLLESLRDYGRQQLEDADELAKARTALEDAVLRPLHEDTTDFPALVNELHLVIRVRPTEDVTRREAATQALAERLDTAAFIFSSCAFREDPGGLDEMLDVITSLATSRDELDPSAWEAANAAKLHLERATRRYAAVHGHRHRDAGRTGPEDPARAWFESWRCALDHRGGARGRCRPRSTRCCRGYGAAAESPIDWALSQLLATKATGLGVMGRLDEATAVAEESLGLVGRRRST